MTQQSHKPHEPIFPSEVDIMELRDKVGRALKGGEYTQGRGCLKRETSGGTLEHCCLGVAGEVLHPDEDKWGVLSHGTWYYTRDEYNDPETHYLSPEDAAKLGLDREQQIFLAKLNDSGNFTFTQIAEILYDLPIRQERENDD